jgi:hypothetical protein
MVNSKEIVFSKRGNRYVIDNTEIERWLSLRDSRKIELTRDDYVKCLEFALQINYSGHTTSDFGTARRRGVLQAVSNWTQGTLAEIALEKFLSNKYNVKIDLDFTVHGAVVGQDITQVRKGQVINPPRKRVSIKSGKLNGCFIVVPENEVELEARKSDLYVFVRLEFPEDHILRIVKDHNAFENVNNLIPNFENINAYICGYIEVENLEKVKSIPGVEFTGMRYVKPVGQLKNTDEDWKSFADSI